MWICLFNLLLCASRDGNLAHGCPSGPRGYVKAVMCSHSRVRVPLRAFFFFEPIVSTKQQSDRLILVAARQ